MDQDGFQQQYSKRKWTKEVQVGDPSVEGAFSIDINGNFMKDMSAIKYLKYDKNNVNYDLKAEILNTKASEYICRDRFNHMLTYIMENPQYINKGKPFNADIVCTKGDLRFLLSNSYFNKPFEIKAVNLRGTIYIKIDYKDEVAKKTSTDENKLYENPNKILKQERKIKDTEYGHAFENLVLSSNPNDMAKSKSEYLSIKDEFCVLMSRKIDDLNILFVFECDGVKSDSIISNLDDLKKAQLVEVKTRIKKPDNSHHNPNWTPKKQIFNRNSSEVKSMSKFTKKPSLTNSNKINNNNSKVVSQIPNAYHNKLLDWWSQSYISGTQTIYNGVRDKNGRVNKIEEIKTEDLENFGSKEDKSWSKTKCLAYLKTILNYIFNYRLDESEDGTSSYIYSHENKTIRIGEMFLPSNYVDFINNYESKRKVTLS